MAALDQPEVQKLLSDPNYAVVSTLNEDGSIHSTVVWVSAEDGAIAINSAVGRKWPTNLERDQRVTVLVIADGSWYHFVEIRGTARSSIEGADEHIDALAKKYIGQDKYPFRRPGEQRIKFVIAPEHIRYVHQR